MPAAPEVLSHRVSGHDSRHTCLRIIDAVEPFALTEHRVEALGAEVQQIEVVMIAGKADQPGDTEERDEAVHGGWGPRDGPRLFPAPNTVKWRRPSRRGSHLAILSVW